MISQRRVSEAKPASLSSATGGSRSANPLTASIANPDVAHDAFAPRGDGDAALNVAIGAVVGPGHHDDTAAVIAAVVMMVVGVERMVVVMMVERMVMMVVMVELRDLHQGLGLSRPDQLVGDQRCKRIRDRF